MTHEYFSDKEKGKIEKTIENIPKNVWNGIVAIYNKLISNNHLSKNFPIKCPDNGRIYDCDRSTLESLIEAEIPNLEIPIQQCYDEKTPNTYDILDFIEFLYKNISDVNEGGYHKFPQHYHLSFYDDGQNKEEYTESINILLDRNGLVFHLTDDGKIQRTIPNSIKVVIDGIRKKSDDERLNELLEISYSKIILPDLSKRIEGIEKLWDGFERLKTYYDEKNKKKSAEELVKFISEKNSLFEKTIDDEFKALTAIGNKFQIRHFERNKIQITDHAHIDYLFYRMSCLITLCLTKINQP